MKRACIAYFSLLLGTLKIASRISPILNVCSNVPVKLRSRPFFALISYLPVFVRRFPLVFLAAMSNPSKNYLDMLAEYSVTVLCDAVAKPSMLSNSRRQ